MLKKALMFIILLFFIAILYTVCFCKKYTGYNGLSYRITTKNIKKVYVLNPDFNDKRRIIYEERAKRWFGKKPFGQENVEAIRFAGTNGKKDIIFVEQPSGKVITSTEILSKQKELKNGITYKVLDKKHPEMWFYYNNKHYDSEEFSKSKDRAKTIFNRKDLSIGEIGATMSHLRAINDIAEKNIPYALILEDDFYFLDEEKSIEELNKYLADVPYKFDILKLDGCGKTYMRVNNIIKIFAKKGYKWFNTNKFKTLKGMAGGYIISLDGAKKISDFIKNKYVMDSNYVIDLLLYTYLPKYYGFNNIYVSTKQFIGQSSENSSVDVLDNKSIER